MKSSEVALTTIPGNDEDQRVLAVLVHEPGGTSRIELRQQSWGEGLGWFTQSTVELAPHQVAHLRAALGSSGPAAAPRLPAEFARVPDGQHELRVVRADSA
jgi:hypothetical protein